MNAAAVVVDQAASIVEGETVDRDSLVADRTQDEAALDRLPLAGVDGPNPARPVALKLVLADHDALDLAVALNLDRRAQEAHHDPLLLALGRAPGEVREDVDVTAVRRTGAVGVEPLAAELVELHLARVDVDIGVSHLAELADLGIGEGRLGGTAAAEDE